MSRCFRKKSSRLKLEPTGRPQWTPFRFAASMPDRIRSTNVSRSARAISANSENIIDAAGFRFPDGYKVSIRWACQ